MSNVEVAKVRNENVVNGVKRTDGLRRFVSIIDQYFQSGGAQMQFNVVNRKTLIDAQKNPDNYSDLIVRVAGYSAYFTQLSKDVQQDIIERTEERL
ncbi:autonomous glycyl radical cofactor GrcA [Bacillus sp. V33-4]|nr:glycine radical domain-containing protein [Bacillus sp. V33-4]PLR80289.1 autonomous glycyl radical cofactor GrcA [Bacillus sp. V33-4]